MFKRGKIIFLGEQREHKRINFEGNIELIFFRFSEHEIAKPVRL